MKTFADVKRRFALGVTLECIENTYRPEVNGKRRTIAKVQTNALACTVDDQPGLFWTYLAKAKDVTILDPDTFKMPIGRDGHTVTLRFVP